MRKVFKYQLRDVAEPATMPRGARIVHFGHQNDCVTLWVEVDPDQAGEPRQFIVVGTGHEIPDRAVHVATWMDGPFVWHLYELAIAAWTEWAGGDCPVLSATPVDIEHRNGDMIEGAPASVWEWEHFGTGGDIVRYRVAAESTAA